MRQFVFRYLLFFCALSFSITSTAAENCTIKDLVGQFISIEHIIEKKHIPIITDIFPNAKGYFETARTNFVNTDIDEIQSFLENCPGSKVTAEQIQEALVKYDTEYTGVVYENGGAASFNWLYGSIRPNCDNSLPNRIENDVIAKFDAEKYMACSLSLAECRKKPVPKPKENSYICSYYDYSREIPVIKVGSEYEVDKSSGYWLNKYKNIEL